MGMWRGTAVAPPATEGNKLTKLAHYDLARRKVTLRKEGPVPGGNRDCV
jgi:hypothetical protein